MDTTNDESGNGSDAERDEEFKVFDEIGKAFADQTPEQIQLEVDKALAEVRAEMRAEREAAARSSSAS